jgi:hypothetical protein
VQLGLLFRGNPWTVALATAGVGLAVAPFLVGIGHPAGHPTALEQRVASLERERDGLRSQLDRTVQEVDRASRESHAVEARLAQALATNRDSVAYAQQLEAELRLRHGEGPVLERSAPPEAAASVGTLSADAEGIWYGVVSSAPELPDATPLISSSPQFVETDSAETRKTRAKLAKKSWEEVVQRAVIGECKGKPGAGRFDACASGVEAQLAPFQDVAQQCMAGDFGGTFYFDLGNRSKPPTNGVSLERGWVVFCDPNLKDGILRDDQG